MPEIPDYNYGLELATQTPIKGLQPGIGVSSLTPVNQPPVSNNPNDQPEPFDIAKSINGALDQNLLKENNWLNSVNYIKPASISKYDDVKRYLDPSNIKYGGGFDPLNVNIEQRYGDTQPAWQAWKNRLLKFGATTIGTFVEGFSTIPDIINAAASGDISKVYDNRVVSPITDWLDSLETNLPNYAKSNDKRFQDWIPLIGNSANTWGDLLQNLGFTAGSIASAIAQDAIIGVLTGGVGDTALIPAQLGKLGKALSGGEKTIQEFTAAGTSGKNLVNAVDAAAKKVSFVNNARYWAGLTTSAVAEASVEANRTQNTLEKDLLTQFYNQNGRDATGQDLNDIKNYSSNAGNAGLIANTALLMITNGIQFSSLFSPVKDIALRGLQQEAAGNVALKLSEAGIWEKVTQPKGFLGFIKKTAFSGKNLIKSNLVEGFEEGAQFAIDESARQFYQNKFDKKQMDFTDNVMQSVGKGLKDTLFTQEGRENVILGFLTGAVIHGAKHLINRNANINRGDQIAALLNSTGTEGLLQDNYGEAVTANNIAAKMDDASKKGDIFTLKNLKNEQLFEFVHSGLKAGKLDLRVEQLDWYGDSLKSQLGGSITPQVSSAIDTQINQIKNNITGIRSDIEKIGSIFANPFNSKSDFENYSAFEEYKKQLSYNTTLVRDSEGRIRQLGTEISTLFPNANVDKVVNLTSKEGIEQTITDFKNRINEIETDEKLLNENKNEFGFSETDRNKLKNEKDFLNEKIDSLEGHKNNFEQYKFFDDAHDILRYYNNLNTLDNKNKVSMLDVIDGIDKSSDVYKLGQRSELATEIYNKLSNKTGMDNYMREYLTAKAVASQANNPVEEANNEQPTGEEIDENGNPVVSKQETKTPEQTQAAEVKPKEKKKYTKKEKEEAAKQGINLIDEPDEEGEPFDPFIETGKKGTPKGEKQPKVVKEEKPAKQPEAKVETAAQKGIRKYEFNPFKYFYKLFTKTKTANSGQADTQRSNLTNIVNNQTPKQIYDSLTFKVKESTEGKSSNEYSKYKNFNNVYYTGYKYDIELFSNGKSVGYITPSERIYFKRGDTFLPISEITKEEYEPSTGNSPETHEDFIKEVTDYTSSIKKIEEQFKGGKTDFTNEDVKKLFNIGVSYGGIDIANSAGMSTLLKNITYDKPGNLVVSLPMVYNSAKGITERDEPIIINKESMDAGELLKALKYIDQNIDKLKGLNTRYLFIPILPTGEYYNVPIAARPAEASPELLKTLFTKLTTTETDTKDKVAEANRELKEQYYIADSRNPKGSGTNMFFTIGEKGQVYFNIVNKNVESKANGITKVGFAKRYEIPNGRNIKSIEEMISSVNSKLYFEAKSDNTLQKLDLQIEKGDIKTGILDDDNVNYEQLKSSLSVAVVNDGTKEKKSDLFTNSSLNILPTGIKPKVETKTATNTTAETKTTTESKPKEITTAKAQTTDKKNDIKKLESKQLDFLNKARKGMKNTNGNFESKIGEVSYEAPTVAGLVDKINKDFANQRNTLEGIKAPEIKTEQATVTSTKSSESFIKDKEAKQKARDEAKSQSKEDVNDEFFNNLDCK